jgi:hypothetical protein
MKNMANLKKIATELFWKFSSPERLSLHHTISLPQYQLGKIVVCFCSQVTVFFRNFSLKFDIFTQKI